MLKTLDKCNLKGKTVLLRVAYDITMLEKNNAWIVPDDQRITATLPTIEYLLGQKCKIILMTWLGRPKAEKIQDKYKLDAVAQRLSSLIGKDVKKLNKTIGPDVKTAISKMKKGDLIMLENTRFNKGEIEADTKLAKKMAGLADFVVFDAFAQAHRIHASTTGILKEHQKTCCAGLLMDKENRTLNQILESPMEPFVVVLGGAKISDKIAMIENIINKASIVLIGGALANPFLKAKGFDVGGSLIESTFIDHARKKKFDPVKVAKQLLKDMDPKKLPYEVWPREWPNGEKTKLKKIQLPIDILIAKKTKKGFDSETIKIEKINGRKRLCKNTEAILDIGPHTSHLYKNILKNARTIFWNGPMGYFEDFNFSQGTKDLGTSIANSQGFSIVGGGDTEGIVTKFNLENRFGHVSTGGGASLSLLAGNKLPVIKYLTV